MNRNNSVAESHRDFIFGKHSVIDPISAIVQELLHFGANLILVYPKVLIRRSKSSSPPPNLPKHPLVQFLRKIVGEYLLETKLSLHRPFDGLFDAKLFEFVKLTTCRDGGDQEAFLLIFIQRCLTIWVIEI